MERQRSILSAEWINERLERVIDRAEKIIVQRLLDEGLLSSGYAPGEVPVDRKLLERMTPEEVKALLNGLDYNEMMKVLMGAHHGP